MGALIDSNMIEYLTDTASAKDFLNKLYHYVYLIEPYYEFYFTLMKTGSIQNNAAKRVIPKG